MLFFICEALADGPAQQTAGGWMSFLPMIGFIAILYFLLIRPQQKKQKEHMALLASIKKGDKVVTNSGIIATVSKVLSDQEVVLEIANGVHCKFVKAAIASVLNQEVSEKQVNAEQAKAVETKPEESPIQEPTAAEEKTEKPKTVRKATPRKKTANKE